MDLTRVDTIVQFTQGSAAAWENVNVPVPAGAVIIDTVNKVVKEGDGSTLFANLPICLDYNFGSSTSGAENPMGDDVGKLVIADDEMYRPSNVTLSSILSTLAAKAAKSIAQTSRMDALISENTVLEVSEGVVDGTIVICNNGTFIPGDKTLAQLTSDLIASVGAPKQGMHISDLVWYSDAGLTNPVTLPNEISEQNTYWCKISGFHDTAELQAIDFGLATLQSGIEITTSAKEATSGLIAAAYGGAGIDQFYGVAVDSSGNIICAGVTNSEGTNYDALVVKFDSSLNIVARKRYGGANPEYFLGVAVDHLNNIICAGYTGSEGAGSNDGLVVKFDSSLNIIARKRYGGASDDRFLSVAIDSANNIICAGQTNSEGTGMEALVVKFDSSLNIVARKRYGGASSDYFYGVITDSANNIICAGITFSEGTTCSALIVKFDSNLAILARKIYNGSGADTFYGVATDSANNIICVGNTTSEGAGTAGDALVVKFDTNLNLIAQKIYGGDNGEYFRNVAIDHLDNIICVGESSSNSFESIIIAKFDSSLNLLAGKRYNGASLEYSYGVTTDSLNGIICVGYTSSDGPGTGSALTLKLPADIPAGSVTGTILTGLTLTDSTLTLAESTLTLTNSTLTLADSTLTLADSALTLADSTLTLERDVMVVARLTTATKLITTVYSSAEDDHFTAANTDNLGNIVAVGFTNVSGQPQAIVVKFDNLFNPIARKLYAGNYNETFRSVICDAANNIIAVGDYQTASGAPYEAFIAKFDPALATVISHKTYGAAGNDSFLDVIMDSAGSFLVVGYTTSEGSGLKDALIVKFNSSLAITAKKRYGGNGDDVLRSLTMDVTGNAICVGYTGSEGANRSGLVMKLDSNLNVILRKIYNSTLGTGTEFSSVAVTAANVIYCAGHVIIAAGNKGLIAKFDSNINVTANKLYGNTNGGTEFTGVDLDSADNVICVGKTNAEGAGSYDALVMKLTGNLVIVGRKTYGTVGTDAEIDCVVDANDDIIMSGYSVIEGSVDAMITKIPGSLPVGVYTNKNLTDLILSDSKLTLSDDNATVSNSALTMADSALTLTNGSMTLGNSNGAVVTDTTIMDAVSNVFKVAIGDVVTTAPTPITFNVVAHDGDIQVAKDISVNVNPVNIIAAVYGGGSADIFTAVTTDSSNNIICAGYTGSEGVNGNSTLVVRFDSSLNILAKKLFGGSGHDYFYGVAADSSDNIICAGYTGSEEAGNNEALVVKFDSSLNVLAKKCYGGTGSDVFRGVAVDSSGNIICAGITASEGVGSTDGLVVKFDSSLNIVARKRYGGAGFDQFYGVAVDSSDNIICAGYTDSEGTGGDALVVKLDSSLNLIARKRYGGTLGDSFQSVTVDSLDNIICVGYTASEGAGSNDGLVVKFDNSLNIVARKRYGGTDNDLFYGVAVDGLNNIICSGSTSSEGAGSTDALVVKFDSLLNVVDKKRYGGAYGDVFNGVTTDSSDNIICAGYTGSEGAGDNDALVVKLSASVPSGTFTGTVLTGLTLADSTLTLADSALTLANSALTLADSTLTLADSTLTLADSTLTQEIDLIMV